MRTNESTSSWWETNGSLVLKMAFAAFCCLGFFAWIESLRASENTQKEVQKKAEIYAAQSARKFAGWHPISFMSLDEAKGVLTVSLHKPGAVEIPLGHPSATLLFAWYENVRTMKEDTFEAFIGVDRVPLVAHRADEMAFYTSVLMIRRRQTKL